VRESLLVARQTGNLRATASMSNVRIPPTDLPAPAKTLRTAHMAPSSVSHVAHHGVAYGSISRVAGAEFKHHA
jgi:hypothetical protein